MSHVRNARLSAAMARFLPLPAFAALYLFLGFVTRLVLWARFGTVADVPAAHLPALLAAGIVNDAVESLYLLAPFAVFLLAVPDRWMQSRVVQGLLTVGCVATIALLVYLGAAEFYFFEEFDARFNLVAFDYLLYPAEVFTDIWQAYPVVKVLLVTVALSLALAFALRRWLLAGAEATTTLATRLAPFAVHATALAAAITWYPTNALSWSANRVENEILQNGYSSFFRAAATSEIDYDAYYPSGDAKENLGLLAKALGTVGSMRGRTGWGA